MIFPDWFPALPERLSKARRIEVQLALVFVFVFGFYHLAHSQWREEQAAAQEGQLRVERPIRATYPRFQIGDSGTVFTWNPNAPLKLFQDAQIRFTVGADGSTEITTTVEDREGHAIVDVVKNHWHIDEAASDKNYTQNAIEVLDKGGHVVLQIRLLPDRMIVWGEWHNEFDQAAQMTTCPGLENPNTRLPCTALFGPAFPEKTNRVHVEPMFKYPSREHWGEFAH